MDLLVLEEGEVPGVAADQTMRGIVANSAFFKVESSSLTAFSMESLASEAKTMPPT